MSTTASGESCEPSNCPSDLPLPPACDLLAQDCPSGQKCVVRLPSETFEPIPPRCVPMVDEPAHAGELCFVLYEGDIPDSCDEFSICFDTDFNNYCTPLCMGSPEAPTCADPDDTCGDFMWGHVCYPSCEPFAPTCAAFTVCAPGAGGFLCAPDYNGIEGARHDVCDYASDCNEGLACVAAAAAVECDQEAGKCCELLCDLGAPDPGAPCTGQGQECIGFYTEGLAPPGLEDVGICTLP